MHNALKKKFLGFDKIEPVFLTTTQMKDNQFALYIDEIKNFYAQEGFVIPEDNDIDYNTIEDFLAYS